MRLSVLNQKGGTGKTTTAVHLAYSLAKRNRRVLLVDNDPQGSVAVYLKAEPHGLSDFLQGKKEFQESKQTLSSGLTILASGPKLLEVETRLHQDLKTLDLYREALHGIENEFDDILFDMAPSRSRLNEAALHYVEEVLIPVSCDYLALVGVRDILEFIEQINAQRAQPIRLRGILPTMYDSRSRVSKEAVALLTEHFPAKVFPPIHHTARAKEAPSYGKTLFEYAPQNPATSDYEWLGRMFS